MGQGEEVEAFIILVEQILAKVEIHFYKSVIQVHILDSIIICFEN